MPASHRAPMPAYQRMLGRSAKMKRFAYINHLDPDVSAWSSVFMCFPQNLYPTEQDLPKMLCEIPIWPRGVDRGSVNK